MFNAPRLSSIEELRREDVTLTKEKPIRMLASDFNDYYVKVQRSPDSLVTAKEWLCAHFLKIWELPVPDFAVIDVEDNHVPIGFHPDYQPFHFERPAFGSKAEKNAIEVSNINVQAGEYQRELSSASGDLLKIALFDLWIANDDRSEGHYNLLYSADRSPRFVPIDHETTFNGIRFGTEPQLQEEYESLATSVLFRTYVSTQQKRQYTNPPSGVEDFKHLISEIQNNLPNIIAAMPVEWRTTTPNLLEDLQKTIFQETWLDNTWTQFIAYVSR